MAAGLGSQEAAWSSHDDEEIVSDGEQPVAAWAWQPAAGSEAAGALRQLNGLLPPAGQQQQQQGLDACQSRGANAFSRAGPSRAPLTSSRAGAFRRPMKTAAAAEADRAASERAATDAAQLAAALGEGQQGAEPAAGGLEQGEPQPAPAPRPPPRMPAAGASFLSRRVLPPSQARVQELRQQLERSAAAATTGDGMPASAAGTRQVQRQQAPQEGLPVPAGDQTGAAAGPTPAAFADRPSSAGHRAVGTAAPGAAAVAAAAAAAVAPATAAAATFHRTSEGLNVVYLNRQQQPDSHAGGRGGGKAKADSVNSGWGNNFVRIDLKKGRGSTKYGTKYGSKQRKRGRGGRGGGRWQATRLRQVGDGADFLEGWQGSRKRCFKCGSSGHFAKDCTAEAQAGAGALAGSSDSEDDRSERSAAGVPSSAGATQPQQQTTGTGPRLASAGIFAAAAAAAGPAPPDPAEQHANVLADPSEAALTSVLRSVFGHPAFRGLQLPTVQRLLAGESLLSIMPTGMGKSLCYALPAALLPGLTLVVSPLIALMHDQAAAVPPPLTAAVLWSGQSRADALQVLADVAAGRIKLLFVSPERLGNPHLLEALRPRMPLPLVVVDEAHCVAEWGHSFRPAYFRLGAALAGSIQAQRVLALTATATRSTEVAIRQVLRIPAANVLRDAAVRQNLRLQVVRSAGGSSSQASRERACALFAAGGPLAASRSAIVYCAFKEDANQLARMLGARGVSARAYHAGKDYRERSAIESDFASGRVRVVVATVAFGMGINLASVSAVVHATMPRSLEEYVQQVGRAGRDGSEAQCVALLDDADFVRLRSLAFSGVLDLAAVRAFLQAVFSPAAEGQRVRRSGKSAAQPAGGRSRKRKAAAALAAPASGMDGEDLQLAGASQQLQDAAEEEEEEQQQQQQQQQQQDDSGREAQETCAPVGQRQSSHDAEAAAGQDAGSGADAEVAGAAAAPRRFGVLAVRQLAAELDMREDSMEAVLSYLEADDAPFLRMLPATALSVKVSFYAAAPEALASQYPVVQAVLEACPNPRNGLYSAAAARLAAAAQKAPGLVLQELRDMAAGSLIGFELSREEGLAYEIVHSPVDLDVLAQQVHDRLALVLGCQVARLDTSYRAIAAAAQLQGQEQEAALREAVERYFDEEDGAGGSAAQQSAASGAFQLDTHGLPLRQAEPALLQAARAVLRRNREQAGPALSARALARILHGVGSPAFPPDAWSKRMGAFWGGHSSVDFAAVFKAAEIVLRDSGS